MEMKRLRENCQMKLCFTPVYNFPEHTFKISFLNARSLHKNFNNVTHDTSIVTSDILAFAEARLHPHESEQYVMTNYTLHINSPVSNSTERTHLGLAVYIKNTVEVQNITNLNFTSTHFIVAKVFSQNKLLQIVTLYRKCNSAKEQFYEDFAAMVTYIESQQDVVIVGDFNYDFNDNIHQNVCTTIETLYSLIHVKTEPSFQNTQSLTTIYHAFTNIPQHQASVIECPYSDHKMLTVALL